MADVLITDVIAYLKQQFPAIKFYSNTIDANKDCVGVYNRGELNTPIALGGRSNNSFDGIDVQLIVHISKDANIAENQSRLLYDKLHGITGITINGKKIVSMTCLSRPTFLGRDTVSDIVEMSIRCRILYER